MNRICPRTVIFIEGEKTEVKVLSRFFEKLKIKFCVDVSCNDNEVNKRQEHFLKSNSMNKVFIRRASWKIYK